MKKVQRPLQMQGRWQRPVAAAWGPCSACLQRARCWVWQSSGSEWTIWTMHPSILGLSILTNWPSVLGSSSTLYRDTRAGEQCGLGWQGWDMLRAGACHPSDHLSTLARED